MPLEGLRILLAGGGGGLGSATAELLRAEGGEVIISSRSHGIRADITKAEDRKRLLDSVEALYGLVIFTGTPARGSGEDVMRLSHEVNYQGPILLAREAAERMKTNGTQGAIVLFSTMQAVALFPGSTVYAGEKAALLHAARILAKEVSRGGQHSCQRDCAGSDGCRYGEGEYCLREVRRLHQRRGYSEVREGD